MTAEFSLGDSAEMPRRDDGRADERLDFLLDACRQLVHPLDLRSTLTCLSRLVVPYLGDCCLIHLLDKTGALVPADGIPPEGLPKPVARAMWFPVPADHDHPLRRLVKTGKSLVLSPLPAEAWRTMLHDPEGRCGAFEPPYEAVAFVPLLARDRLIGTMMVGYKDLADRRQALDLAQLESLADRAALAIENARLIDEARSHERTALRAAARAEALLQVAAGLSEALTAKQVADVVVTTARKVLGAVACAVYRLNAAARALQIEAADGYEALDLQLWRDIPLDIDVPATRVVRSGDPLFLATVTDWGQYGDLTWRPEGDLGVALLPLHVGGGIWGLTLFTFTGLHAFSSEERDHLLTMTHQCRQALDRARLFDGHREAAREAELANRRLAFLATAGSLLAQSLDVDATLSRITDLAVPALADVCVVTLIKEDGSLHSPGYRHCDPAGQQSLQDLLTRAKTISWSESFDPVRTVIASGQAMVVSDLQPDLLRAMAPDGESLRLLETLGVASFMIVPLAAHGRRLGTLTFGRSSATPPFGPQDVALAEDLGQRAGLAIENARLYGQMQDVLQRERQARVAAEAAREQQAILARASDLFGQGLTPGQMAECLAELVVPRVADWCVIVHHDSAGTLRPLAARHLDADRDAQLQALPVVGPGADHPLRTALALTGPTVLAGDGGGGLPIVLPGSGEQLLMPLVVGDRKVGLFVLGLDGRDRHFTALEHALAVDLAERAADAVDRAFLYEHLQQALAREQAARIEVEQAWQHSALLAEAGRTLSESLDLTLTVTSVADLVVPRLADACGVFRFDDAGGTYPLVMRHRDPEGQVLLDQMPPPEAGPLNPFGILRTTGRAVLLPSFDEAFVTAIGRDEDHRAVIRRLFQGAFYLLPLRVRGRLIGALTVLKGPEGATFSVVEQALLSELADRTALSLQNALLFQEVQQANQRKAEFLAVLGHELRNPLGAVSNGMHLLDRIGSQDPEIKAHRQAMHRQVRQLSRLVSDLLDLSRVDSGKIALEPERLILGELVAQAIETVQVLHAERQPVILCSMSSEAIWVDADRVRLTQVLVNLIDNAIKYSPPGSEVRVSLERTGAVAVIQVQDQGQGMTPDLMARVFEPFVQGRSGGSGGGLGLGLTLVRTLAELHGGTVRVASAGPGRGSTLMLTLPVCEGGEVAEPPSLVAAPGPRTPDRPAVLVVEDHPDAGQSMVELLKVMDYRASLAVDGPGGVAKALELRPRVALVDIGLPGFDGYEVARRLRAALGPDIRLVALTGYGLPEDRVKAFAAGFDNHLTKPVDVGALLALLDSAVNG